MEFAPSLFSRMFGVLVGALLVIHLAIGLGGWAIVLYLALFGPDEGDPPA